MIEAIQAVAASNFCRGHNGRGWKADFDFILITEYGDSTNYRLAEERFDKIIKEINPNGPKLLNALKPNEFRNNIFFKKALIISTN